MAAVPPDHETNRRTHGEAIVGKIAWAVLTSLVLLLNAGVVGAAPGSPPLFGTDAAFGNLLRVDFATGVGTIIGSMGRFAVPALAVDPTSRILYAGGGGGFPFLYTVNTDTGAATLVGDTGLGPGAAIGDIDFRSDGTLFAAVNIAGNGGTGADHLAIINKNTGTTTIVGPFGSCTGVTIPSTGGGSCTIEGMEGIAFDSVGRLWGSHRAAANGAPGLYLIDTTTGAATFQYPIVDAAGQPPSGGVASLRFLCGDSLYGGTATPFEPATDGGRLISINQFSGQFTFVGATAATAQGNSLGALAFGGPCTVEQPPSGAVPTLSEWAMSGLAALLAVFGARAIRRRRTGVEFRERPS